MKLVFGLAMWAALCCAATAEEPAPATESPTPAPAIAEAATKSAAEIEATPAVQTAPAVQLLPPGHGLAPKNSVVIIQVAEPLSSKTAKVADKFRIQLAEPIVAADGVLVPAGTAGVGEVISVSKAGAMAKAGELVLAARYLDFNGQQIPLKAFKFGGAGKNNSTGVGIAMMVAPLPIAIALLAVPGGNIDIPAGALANAKLAADLTLPVQPPAPAPSADAQPSVQPAQ